VSVLLSAILAAAGAIAQTPTPAPAASPTPVASDAPAAPEPSLLDSLGVVVKDGHFAIEADLEAGKMPLQPAYDLEVEGSPLAKVSAEAVGGVVTKMHFDVSGGRLVVRGRGLRPKVEIESLDFESPRGITGFKFRGLGLWRPIVAIFGGVARSAVGKLELKTDIPSVLRGEMLGAKKPEPAAAATVPPPAAPPGRSFLDLVREVRVQELTLTAFEGKAIAFPPFIDLTTASAPRQGEALAIVIAKGVFRPGRGGAPAEYDFPGRFEGEFEKGSMEFGNDRAAFSRGRISGGTFRARSGSDGKLRTAVTAKRLALDLESGDFEVPGGARVALAEGSRFTVANLEVTPERLFSGVLDLDLNGKTGVLVRQGAKISAANVHVRSSGLSIARSRATGAVEMSFDYLLRYPFTVRYPVKEIAPRTLDLIFHGPFAAKLELTDAGGPEGQVRGEYTFKAPWAPVEAVVLEVLRAKWTQDLAIKRVDFNLEGRRFRPCGNDCFELGFTFLAEKKSGKSSLFRQYCEPLGKAELVLDGVKRTFTLHNLKVETHCKGAIGWVVNFVAPLLAKTYSDTVIFQMPADVPLSIDRVDTGAEWIRIEGRLDWKADTGKPAAPN
jgi:hypothetical protein